MFGFWYLLSCTCLINILDSYAKLRMPSFFTEIKIEGTKCLSELFLISRNGLSSLISKCCLLYPIVLRACLFCRIGSNVLKNSAHTWTLRLFPTCKNKCKINVQKYMSTFRLVFATHFRQLPPLWRSRLSLAGQAASRRVWSDQP